MLLERLREIIADQAAQRAPKRLIRRDVTIPLESKHVNVLSGVRRAGKSTLLLQLRQQYDGHYLNFEDPRLISFTLSDFEKLERAFRSFGKKRRFFFDEIQNLHGWERAVRHLHDRGFKCVVTGSNAAMLSRELGTLLTGRHLTTELFPFSYGEYLRLTKVKPGARSAERYLRVGGFPEYLREGYPQILRELLTDIIQRDVVARYGLREEKLPLTLAVFLLTNVGKEFSYNKLARRFGVAVNTLINYIDYLESAYLLFTVQRFSPSFKKQLLAPKKIYGVDTGFVTENSVSRVDDVGRLLENAVFLHLRRQGNVFYFKGEHECDFISDCAVQVCYTLTPENHERELAGLREAVKATGKKGVIVTMNQEEVVEGFPVIPFWKWVMGAARSGSR